MPSSRNDPISGRLIPGAGENAVDSIIDTRNTNISPSVGVTTTGRRSITIERTIGSNSSSAAVAAIEVGTPWKREATTSTLA